MRYFTKSASAAYMTRLLVFWSVRRIAHTLAVSVTTVERWLENGRVPARYEVVLDRALDRLSVELKKRGKEFQSPNFFEEMAKLIDKSFAVSSEEVTLSDPQQFTAALRRVLPCNQRKVMALAREHGVSRRQAYRVADDLGVIKQVKGLGPKMTSTWRMP